MIDLLFVALFQAVAGDPAAAVPATTPSAEDVAPAAEAAPLPEAAPEAAPAPAAEETAEAAEEEAEAQPRRRQCAAPIRTSGTRLAVGPRCRPERNRSDD